MRDERVKKLAQVLLDHSVKIKKEEVILITVLDDGLELAKELVRVAYKRGAYPFVDLINTELSRLLLDGATEERYLIGQKWDMDKVKDLDATIRIYGKKNDRENSNVAPEKLLLHNKASKPYLDHLINHTKWVLMNFPNASQAQKAGMSLDDFEDFYFEVCTMDYGRMKEAMFPLKELMDRTNNVHIKGPGTDLTFSIKNMGSIVCAGENNIPDGEVYTAPVRDSVNGYITFNAPTIYNGTSFEGLKFEFENGKIIHATSNHNSKLNKILDTDDGSRYIGEFAIGVNPYILQPMNDTLFDEKIAGSFHFTPGQSYNDESYNGNDSKIHWDIVNIQRPDYGGGEIWFDDLLVRKDGLFVPHYLLPLNPENLIK
ncbi:aminopeptidase [Fictibacillus sp. BK138]|uniref:aminopeptidase n=1 Tax=Fictibacillus sp. BK138 TaxID=2512121 RepID=UPI0010296A3B|nr:aminopeptidase [Fictibacillus sp. BK138]RZT15493.1 aminopeptidase [Fictibacillus sp. BK138]